MHLKKPKPRIARRRRLVAAVALSIVLGVVAAVMNLYGVGIIPPSVKGRHTEQATAAVRAALVIHPSTKAPAVTHGGKVGELEEAEAAEEAEKADPHKLARPSEVEGLTKRATLVGNVMSAPPTVDRIARLMDVSAEDIAAETDVTIGVPQAFYEPNFEQRAAEIVKSRKPYRIDIQPGANLAVIDVFTQAETPAAAAALAEATVTAANETLEAYAQHPGIEGTDPVSLLQLGAPRGGAVETSGSIEIVALTFLVVFSITFGLLVGFGAIRRGWALQRDGRPTPPPGEPPARRARDDWPHTNRILPWMIAAFIVILWTMPINAITLNASLPIELKLDRLVLPVVVIFWLLAMAAGGRGAPRWRFTTVHAVVAGFVAIAFLSVVANAVYLDHTLELPVAIKKLSLLGAFALLFLIVSTSVRPTEVRPFLTLMLGMSVVCGLGILWELRFDTNVFYRFSTDVLPGFFSVAPVNAAAVDEIGRRAVVGPAELGLEAVAMLAMAMPIGLTRLMESRRTKERLVSGAAVLILFGAMLATYRKSALLAPLTIIIVLAIFRRREMLRLAPLGIGALIAMPLVAPNALGSIIGQFRPTKLGVSTVSDRVSDYDAIRPDLLSHPLLGRGYGAYEHTSYRTLDNDLLMRVVETGLIGLSAYVVMLIGVVVIAAPVIRARRPEWAGAALSVAAASAAFLVLSVLFDVMSFPHTPYLLMILFGLLAVVIRAARAEAATPASRDRGKVPILTPFAEVVPAPSEERRTPEPV